jgi:hypothetical protein
MNRKHALLIAVMLGLAALVGAFALARTTHLGAASQPKVSAARIARQEAALTRAEASLRRRVAHATAATPAAPAPQAQRVMYVRPKPIVVTVHRHGGEHEQESRGGASDD